MVDRLPEAGDKLGPYTILGPMGAGGMGVVYHGRDERLGRDVAIKVVRFGLMTDEAARRRFRKEALALAKLNHPNIATVYDVGVQDGFDYIVMEFVRGQTLRDRLIAGPMPSQEIVALAVEVAAGLEEAHEQGVVHRDLKPANVMITAKGHAKILDFGLAKLLAPAGAEDLTQPLGETRGVVGTPLYMSPEQAEGRPIDPRTDLWSLGVLLYESFSGRAPFRGDSGLAILRAITNDDPPPLRDLRADVPADAVRIITRALEKDADRRYQSASEMGRDLSAASAQLSAPALTTRSRARVAWPYIAATAVVVTALAAWGLWFYRRAERRHWAREEAIPQIQKLISDERQLAAFFLLKEAELALPGDPQLAEIRRTLVVTCSVTSSPPGATAEIQDYLTPDQPWFRLGVTPLDKVSAPNGYFRWRLVNGGQEFIAAPALRKKMKFDLAAINAAPRGMTLVNGGEWADMIAFIGWIGPITLPSYYIDRTEVTNRDFQQFVDSGGYSKREYWKEKFVRDGKELDWNAAMALLRDRTGRAGPATWSGGHHPDGQADFPVSGVSWYEASAYAAYAGKTLPVLAQWFRACPPYLASSTVLESNISHEKLAAVDSFKGHGPFGTVDMIGNVREWIENRADEDAHFMLGGAWNSLTYLSVDPEALPAFDRSPENGFRAVRTLGAMTIDATGPIPTLHRDFEKYKPASDEVFRAYQAMYAYDKAHLDPSSEGVIKESADYREEKVSFNAAYADERVTAYLFLPKRVRPPFETVVFFPSARVLDLKDSKDLGDTEFFDYIVQSGRAVLYPVYKGTYERQDRFMRPGKRHEADLIIQRYRDLGRALDYLQTRPDIDKDRLAYLGVSMGSAEGVIYTTLRQDAFKTVIFLDGGYFLVPPDPGTDQADFAPRLKKPVLMVNGRYDFTFSLARSQEPLFRMLGTPAADKRHVVLETPHDVTTRMPELIAAVLPWLDKYLGPIQSAQR
jgi:predicted Ser/Thr protein kinase/dienelactone hydrolase